jgi:hypothetical protein
LSVSRGTMAKPCELKTMERKLGRIGGIEDRGTGRRERLPLSSARTEEQVLLTVFVWVLHRLQPLPIP